MSAAFFDTNIVVYAADSNGADETKRHVARALMRSRSVVSSTQVMLELYGVMRKKLGYAEGLALRWVHTLHNEDVVTLTPDDVLEALRMTQRFQTSQWDGLILRAATKAGVDIVYTEDLNHGQTYGDVRVCNPFIEDFLA